MKQIDLDEILKSVPSGGCAGVTVYSAESVKKAMREAINQALEIAAEEASVKLLIRPSDINEYVVNKQSILNVKNAVK